LPVSIYKPVLYLLFAVLPFAGGAQQASAPARSPGDRLRAARERLQIAEAKHPGNSVEVARALNAVVDNELNVEGPTAEVQQHVKQALSVAENATDGQSEIYLSALLNQANLMIMLDRPADARPLAEKSFVLAQQKFTDAPEFSRAAFVLFFACDALGDLDCARRTNDAAMVIERKGGSKRASELALSLTARTGLDERLGNKAAAEQDIDEALSIAAQLPANDASIGLVEQRAGEHYTHTQEFSKAIAHFTRALEVTGEEYDPDFHQFGLIRLNLAAAYSRSGDFPLAWKNYESAIYGKSANFYSHIMAHAQFARSLASGGDPQRAIAEGLQSAQMTRESFVLQARVLPERQAIRFYEQRSRGLDIALSVLARHAELSASNINNIYQETVRSRALVADEMARRQKNLNANNDPEIARLLKKMDQARSDLLAIEQAKQDNGDAMQQATQKMEAIESDLAIRSAALRNDERVNAVRLEDLRRSLPANSVLISYVAYRRFAVDQVDPAYSAAQAYMAFVLKPGSDTIQVFDLGKAWPIDRLVTRARASADAEAHAGGYDAKRNERAWREAAAALRELIWDPLRAEVGNAKLALVVPDGMLNLIPFSALPDGNGYLVERGPVIHVLSSERDLVPTESTHSNTGLVIFGNPAFGHRANEPIVASLRDASIPCDGINQNDFPPLPGTALEAKDIRAEWKRWNGREASMLETGSEATRARFLADAPHSRILHVATHAFLLGSSCGNGNPLLRSGLVFAHDGLAPQSSILTAQQIASMDLNGVDWAVLSACNTGNGDLQDGEGVLGLERAFRVAGVRSVVMSLWPVDDTLSRQFMHELYLQRLGLHASTADAVWNSERKLLLARRAAGKSTHPWYWAGFLASGGWQ
jgi:CHAT domain-containing protein/tetratricopeptide (TPR) repeat protein